jgi:hypothetical protein
MMVERSYCGHRGHHYQFSVVVTRRAKPCLLTAKPSTYSARRVNHQGSGRVDRQTCLCRIEVSLPLLVARTASEAHIYHPPADLDALDERFPYER